MPESLPSGRLSHFDPAKMTPVAMVVAQMGLQVVLWSLVPILLYAAPPLDVVESYVHGPRWVLTTLKHPALPSWVLEATRVATGAIGWPAYIVSQVFVAATLWAVFALGRDMLGPVRAAIGTLALSGVVYFSWVTIEFNHNVALMPLWAGFFLGLWRSVETGRLVWWLATGVLAAAMMHTKLSAAVGVLVGALWLISDPTARRALMQPSPWIAAALSAALVVPLYLSLKQSDFAPLAYAAARAQSATSGVFAFVAAQALALIGMAALLAVSHRLLRSESTAAASVAATPHRARVYLVLITLGPLVVAIAGAIVSGTGLRSAWGTSMLSFCGLLAVAFLPALTSTHLRPMFIGSCAITGVAAVGFACVHLWQQSIDARPPRGSWPRVEMAAAVRQIWTDETGRPLRYVAGHFWPVGLVTLSGGAMPTLLVDGDLASAPGVTLADLKRDGVLIINAPNHTVTPDTLAGLAAPRKIGTVTIPFRQGRRGQTVTLRYAIVAPE